MIKNRKTFLIVTTLMTIVLLAVPVYDVFAGGYTLSGPMRRIVEDVVNIMKRLAAVIIGAGVLVFLWGILKYGFSKDDGSKALARQLMLWGIIALTVMIGVWGMAFFLNQFLLGGAYGDNPNVVARETDNLQKKPELSEDNYSSGGGQYLQDSVNSINDILEEIIPFLLTAGALLVVWGVFQYIKTENADKKGKAASFIGWGIFLLFIMTAVWTFINMFANSTNTQLGGEVPGAKVEIDRLIKGE